MTYYKQIIDGVLTAIGTGPIGGNNIEITKEKYETLLAEIREKAALTDQLYNGIITIEDVPAEWREEIQKRVDDRKAWDAENATQDISDAELADMMEAIL